MKFCDMKNMKSEEISTEILPPLKCNTLKHPFGLVSHRARECIYCQECNKPRIIWVERKAPGLEKYIDNLVTTMIFTCGTKLNENDYGCYINVQINCESPINQNYFKKLLGDIVCYKCGTELDSDDVRKYHDEIPTFTSIKPSCEQCGKWIYGKAKKPSRQAKTSGGAKKRKASPKPTKPSKKPKAKPAKKRKAPAKPKNKKPAKRSKPTVIIIYLGILF